MYLLKNLPTLDSYISSGGFESLERALGKDQRKIIQEVERSHLVGRGGAAFPTGLKMKFTAMSEDVPKYIIANADEGEPGTFKDRVLMEMNPYQIVEGMIISAYAIGAKKGFFYIRQEYRKLAWKMENILKELREGGYLGKNILNSRFSFDIEVVIGAGSYVCGEETALIESIEGKRGFPRLKPPYPAQRGLWNKPTLVNNVETLANIPIIIDMGGENYRSLSSEVCAGPKLFSLSGFVKRPGVYEALLGEITVEELISKIGGGVDGNLKAIMIGGGAAGYIVNDSFLDMPLCFHHARERGISLGTGAVIVFNDMVNLWRVLLKIAQFFEHESCGQCFPCRYGTRRIRRIIEGIVMGEGRIEDIRKLDETTHAMKIGSLCPLGTSAMVAYESAMEYFRDELMEVIK